MCTFLRVQAFSLAQIELLITDDVVHVDCEENRVITTDLGDNNLVHVDYEEHRPVKTDLEDYDLVHMDY